MPATRPLRVVVADLPGVSRTALVALIDDAPGLSVVGLVGSLDELVETVAAVRADVALLDDRLLHGRALVPLAVGARVVVTGVDDDPAYAARARRVGAPTWVPKDMPDELLAALHVPAVAARAA